MTPDEFGRACAGTAKALRRVPAELRRDIGKRTKAEVAEPLAADIRTGGARSKVAQRLTGTVRTRAAANPTIVAGGAKRVVSGGAKGYQLIHGTHWGGGERVTPVPAGAGPKGQRHRGYRRHSTRQFHRGVDPFVFRGIYRGIDKAFDRWATIVDDIINRTIG